MIYAFARRRGLQSCFAVILVAIVAWVLGFSWIMIPDELGWARILFAVLAALFGFWIPAFIIDVFSPGPILTISIEGLRYLPYSRETIPWSAISGVSVTLSYWVINHREWRRSPSGDQLSFEVRNHTRYPPPPLMPRIPGPMPILLNSVQASTPEILAAIKSFWHGEVRTLDPAPKPPAP